MSEKGQGDASNVAEFDQLELEGKNKKDKEYPEKLNDLIKYLKKTLKPDQFSEVAKILGIKEEGTLEMVLAAINELVQLAKKKPEEYPVPCGEEDLAKKGYPYPYPGKGSEQELASYKDFMAKCMKEGKSMKDCADAYKKAYPEPKKEGVPEKPEKPPLKEEASELKKLQDQVQSLEAEMGQMKEQKRLSGIASKVDGLITQKQLAPVQRETIIKLMAKMPEDLHGDFLKSFESQRFRGFEDIGETKVTRPGQSKEELTKEEMERLRKDYGIDTLVHDKGFKPGMN